MGSSERQAGDVLDGRYRLVARLGQGGFGDVWRAEELLPDGKPLREVALKLLRRGVASDWTEEARIIASLRHPALVTIYAAGLVAHSASESLPFVAMELLVGENLAAFVDRGEQVAWRRALAWAREAAAALDEIHRAGVVHLDLKPANLFLTGGRVKVLDFGIAQQGQARAADAALTSDDGLSTAAFMAQETPTNAGATSSLRSVVGTPGFMAPEVLEGGEATAAADAYALAACVVQLVTGRLPQEARDRPNKGERTELQTWLSEVQAATVHGRLRDLAAERMPAGPYELMLRWLRLDPMARGADVGSLREQLDAVWLRPHGAAKQPFLGLAPHGLADEGNFYGRGTEIDRLARELIHQPCLVLQGPGGSGLTSLALAGIVPELARAAADARDDWRACHVRLGDDPDASLETQLSSWLGAHGSPASTLGEQDERGHDDGTLLERLKAHAHKSRLGLALVIEDLPAIVDNPARSVEVGALLTAALAGERGLRVIGLLREEHAALLGASALGPTLQPWLRYVGLPSWSAAEELVRGPAAAAGTPIDGAAQVIDDIKGELGRVGASLAAVSLALARWWQGPLSAASWREQGGLVGPLAAHAEKVIAGLDGDRAWIAESLLLRTLRADGSAIEADERQLLGAADDPRRAADVLAELEGARLIMARGGKFRLVHPALALKWRRLHDRRLHDLERLSFLEELRDAALRWKGSGRIASELWSAQRLGELERRFKGLEAELGPDEEAFIDASAALRRKGRMMRGAAGTIVVAFLILAVVLDKAQRERAEEQQRALERASHEAAVAAMVTRSRRTADPYQRIALLAAAIDAGSPDPLLPLELFSTARGLPAARFLSLDSVEAPAFPWDERYLLASTRAHALLFDFDPDEGESWGPIATRLRPHEEGLYDVEPIPFDHAFVTRGMAGQLKVWRLREDRQIALAAESPMRCLRGLSRVLVAARAPVIACSTADGLARWDLRHPDEVTSDAFGGRVLDISPDGAWIAAARQHKLLLWAGKRRFEQELDRANPPALARFSPRDPVVALIDPTMALLFDLTKDPPARLFESQKLKHEVNDPSDVRFAAGGLDLAVCDHEGEGHWLYLRRGARAAGDGPAPAAKEACRPERRWPERLEAMGDYGDLVLSSRGVGPRTFEGGWRRQDGKLVTRDLVTFDGKDSLDRLTAFNDRAGADESLSPAAVVRDGDDVVWQVGADLRAYSLDGKERWRRPGNLLARCPDGRVLAWRKPAEERWELFDAKSDVTVRTIAREPGFVLGADPSCQRLFVQWLDGRIAGARIAGSASEIAKPQPIDPGGGGYVLDGYVYDVRASAGGVRGGEGAPETIDPGLWLAFSSGAMVRADASGALRSYGHASPRATTMADGPSPGELIFADESGVVLRARTDQDRLLLSAAADREWSDVRVFPGGKHALLAAAETLAVLDLARAEIAGEVEVKARGRLAPWDEQGSTLVWANAFMGPARGEVIPIGRELARKVGKAASNLIAELAPDGRTIVRLR